MTLDGLEEAFLYGSYASGDVRAASDLDLFVALALDQEALTERLADVERELDRDVNVATFARAALERLRAAGDRFIETVFAGSRVPLVPQRPVAE